MTPFHRLDYEQFEKRILAAYDKHLMERNDIMNKTPFTSPKLYRDGTMAKVGDKVRRIKEHRDSNGWNYGDGVCEVIKLSTNTASVKIDTGDKIRWWHSNRFEKAEPALKVGDWVTRKPEHCNKDLWPFGASKFEVVGTHAASHTDKVVLEDDFGHRIGSWDADKFNFANEKVESASPEKFYMGIPLDDEDDHPPTNMEEWWNDDYDETVMDLNACGFDPKDLDIVRIDGKKFYHIPDDVASGDRDDDELAVEIGINTLMMEAWGQQEDAGFHRYTVDNDEEVDIPRALALIHSEISEALEGDRKDLVDKHLPQYKQFEVELADAVIRIASLAASLDIDLGGIIVEKAKYNRSRLDHTLAERAKPGGKRY